MWKEGEIMSGKGKELIIALTTLLLIFYTIIVGYVLFVVLEINTSENFIAGLIFEILGIIFISIIVIGAVLNNKKISFGYMVSIILCTVIYIIILNCINFFGIFVIKEVFFVLINLVLLFIYSVIVVPMYIMGKQ